MAALSLTIRAPFGNWDCLRFFDRVVSSSADAPEIASLSSNTYREKANIGPLHDTLPVYVCRVLCVVPVSAFAMLVGWCEVS